MIKIKEIINNYLNKNVSEVLDTIHAKTTKPISLKEYILWLDGLNTDEMRELIVDEMLQILRLSVTDGESTSLKPLFLAIVADIEIDDSVIDLKNVRKELQSLPSFNQLIVESLLKSEIRSEYKNLSREQMISIMTHSLLNSEIADFFKETDDDGNDFDSGVGGYPYMGRFFHNLVEFIKKMLF